MSIGVPIKVLHEAEGHIITCETINGETFRGKLVEAEDNMNCQISNVHVTYRDGRKNELDLVFIRGSKIRFLILPDMLKNAPMFKRGGKTGGGVTAGGVMAGARGKVALMRGAMRGRGGRGGGLGGPSRGAGRGGGSWMGQGPPRGGGGRGGGGH